MKAVYRGCVPSTGRRRKLVGDNRKLSLNATSRSARCHLALCKVIICSTHHCISKTANLTDTKLRTN